MAKKLLFQSWKLPFLPETLSKEIRLSDLAGLEKITQVLRWPLKFDIFPLAPDIMIEIKPWVPSLEYLINRVTQEAKLFLLMKDVTQMF